MQASVSNKYGKQNVDWNEASSQLLTTVIEIQRCTYVRSVLVHFLLSAISLFHPRFIF